MPSRTGGYGLLRCLPPGSLDTMFNNAYLDRPILPKPSKPRYTLRTPEREVAFRQENITREKTKLFLKPRGSPQSQEAYRVTDEEDTSVFTATGQKYNGQTCRELRDASGLPLCDMHKKPMSSPFSWVVTLPGSKPSDAAAVIAKATPQWSWSSIDLHFKFRNSAATETKREEEKDVSLTVKKHGNVLAFFDILDADRRIAEVRESISHNDQLALRRNTRGVHRRPALDLVIAPGMDMSLVRFLFACIMDAADLDQVAVISIILSDWFFGGD